jgi:hypothetical protein
MRSVAVDTAVTAVHNSCLVRPPEEMMGLPFKKCHDFMYRGEQVYGFLFDLVGPAKLYSFSLTYILTNSTLGRRNRRKGGDYDFHTQGRGCEVW